MGFCVQNLAKQFIKFWAVLGARLETENFMRKHMTNLWVVFIIGQSTDSKLAKLATHALKAYSKLILIAA